MQNRIAFFIVVSLLVFAGLGCRNLFNNPREDHVDPKIYTNNQADNRNVAANSQTNVNNSSPDLTTDASHNEHEVSETVTSSPSKLPPKTISGGVLNGKAT